MKIPPPAKCYIDSEFSYASNETSVNENSVWAFVTGYFYEHQDTSTVSVTGHHLESSIRLYPNPSSSEINMYLKGKYEYSIMDITGRNIIKGLMNDEMKLDVSDWRPGLYFMSILVDSRTHSLKFLVE